MAASTGASVQAVAALETEVALPVSGWWITVALLPCNRMVTLLRWSTEHSWLQGMLHIVQAAPDATRLCDRRKRSD